MIEFNNIKEKDLLVYYANEFNNFDIIKIIETGVKSDKEAVILAKFYWKIVDETVNNKDVESLLEKIYTTLHIHCGNRGFSDIWDNEIP